MHFRIRCLYVVLSTLSSASLLLLTACSKKQGAPQVAAPTPVTIATVEQRDVSLYDDWIRSLVTYQRTIKQAFESVSDALIGLQKYQEYSEQEARLAESAEDATRLAKLRYNGGSTSYLEVLTNDTTYYSAWRLPRNRKHSRSCNCTVRLEAHDKPNTLAKPTQARRTSRSAQWGCSALGRTQLQYAWILNHPTAHHLDEFGRRFMII
jgi:hypothetical protein